MSRKLPMPSGNRGSFLALRLGAQMFPFTQERGAGMEALEASLGLKEGSPGLVATRVWLEGHQCQVRGRPTGPGAGGRENKNQPLWLCSGLRGQADSAASDELF